MLVYNLKMMKIKTIVYEEQLNLWDEEFIYLVYKDIDKFLKETNERCVLIFPPLNNRRRYFIHRVGKIFNVQTFSVGAGIQRFTVVCSFEKKLNETNESIQVMDQTEIKKGAISKSRRAPRPDAPIYIPPAIRRSQQTQSTEQKDKQQPPRKQCDKENITDKKEKNNISEPVQCEINVPLIQTTQQNDDNKSTNVPTNISDIEEKSAIIVNTSTKIIDDNNTDEKNNKDNDQEQEEMLRAREEINRRNKKIIKQSYTQSDILIISDLEKTTITEPNKKNIEKDKPPVDSWEDLLDNGQLDSDLMLEITYQVGKVNITTAKEDYKEYSNKSILNGDFSHVIEIYDFPKEFQTRDLVTIIDSFTNATYHIKWVDDNHALGVFSSGFAVTEVLKITHPLIKLRPLTEASKQSVDKAMRYPNAMMPSAVRPQTCPQTARRIVVGALGLKLNNAKEERAQEIKILKEARAKKKLSAKQQDDAWEGNTSFS